MALSPLNQRRWNNFRRNKRAFWSLWIFSVLFGISLFAEFIANDKPILVNYRGELFHPGFQLFTRKPPLVETSRPRPPTATRRFSASSPLAGWRTVLMILKASWKR